jgi:hypothetical protein
MNRMIRSIRSTLGKTLFLSAFALGLLVLSAVTFADQESGAEQHRRRHHDELTFTQIDFPGGALAAAFGINGRGQNVGSFADAGGAVHNFLLDNGAFSQSISRSRPRIPLTRAMLLGSMIAARS